MSSWIGFLRAVNVGKRKYPMVDLRKALSDVGFQDVETHIQTGNVRLASSLRSHAALERRLGEVFAADRGFDVPTLVLTPEELTRLARDCEDVVAEHGQPRFGHYVEILRSPPPAESVALIEEQPEGQRAVVRGRAVHLLFDVAYHQARGASAAQKRALGDSTNRNATVIRALASRWGAGSPAAGARAKS